MNETSVTVEQLRLAMEGPCPPVLLDVRRAAVYEQASFLITEAAWRDPSAVDTWGRAMPRQEPVVVYCVHGHQVSQGCADRLRALGVDARFLEGGIEAWQCAGGASVAKPAAPANETSVP